MDDEDGAVPASAFGLLRCLRALAQEASSLKMLRTLSAIEDAMEAAAVESGLDCGEDISHSSYASELLH